MGTWKMVIDIDEELEEAEREAEEEDSFLGEIIAHSVSGLVSNIMGKIDIYMDFRPNGEVKVMVDAFGEKETEYSEWTIDHKGRLYISDNDNFSTDDDDYWLIEDNILVLFEDGGKKSNNVYMVRME